MSAAAGRRDEGRSAGAPRLEDRVDWFIRLTNIVGRTLTRCLTRVRVEGLEGLALPASGPLIIAANHLSNADPVIIGPFLTPVLGRRIHWLGKQEALEWPLLGPAMARNGVFGIRRGAADLEAFRLARRVLDEGHVLVVFPEGTRSRTGGLQEAKDGLAILALRTGAPILPIGMSGTDRWWPRGRWFPRFGGRVTMRVGRTFALAPVGAGGDRRTAQHEATERIMGEIAALLLAAARGVYGGPSAPASEGDGGGSVR